MQYLEPIDYTDPDFGEWYDELPLWSAPFGLLLLDRIPMQAGLSILDVGAGTGFLTVELAQRSGPDATIIAVDPWTAAVKRLRRKLDHLGLNNVRVIEQDAATIDLPDATIDVVVSNLGINNLEDPAAVLRTCFRVVKPNGRLLLTTNLVGHMKEFYDVYRATLIETEQLDRLAALDAHIGHRGTVESVSCLVREAGFTLLETATDSFRMRFANGSSLLRHYNIRLGFMPGWKAVVATDAVDRTFQMLEHNLNVVARERGELALTIPMLCIEACKPHHKSTGPDPNRRTPSTDGRANE